MAKDDIDPELSTWWYQRTKQQDPSEADKSKEETRGEDDDIIKVLKYRPTQLDGWQVYRYCDRALLLETIKNDLDGVGCDLPDWFDLDPGPAFCLEVDTMWMADYTALPDFDGY